MKDVEDVFGERVLFSNNLLTALILVHLLRRRRHDSSIEMSDPAVYKPEKQPASVKWQPSIHRFSMVLLWAGAAASCGSGNQRREGEVALRASAIHYKTPQRVFIVCAGNSSLSGNLLGNN